MMVRTELWMKKESEKMPKTMPAEAGRVISAASSADGSTPATPAEA